MSLIKGFSGLTGLLVNGLAAVAAGPRMADLNLVADMDVAELVPLLKKGLLTMVTAEQGGRAAKVSAIGLADASPQTVWDTIIDYKSYPKFMNRVKKTRVLEQSDTDIVVEFELALPGPKISYAMRHKLYPPTVIEAENEGSKGALAGGACRWELFPYENDAKTIMVYSVYASLQGSGWLLKQLVKAIPDLDVGVSILSALVTVQGITDESNRRG